MTQKEFESYKAAQIAALLEWDKLRREGLK
jgi:hypothetical protein